MEPSCIICGVHMYDESLHMEWHRKLRDLLQKVVNATYGKGFQGINDVVKEL
jgi:hypothetical protein